MFNRGDAYQGWVQLTLIDESYSEAAENGCQLEVRARANGDFVEVLVCVYAADGERVVEHLFKLPASESTVEQGLERGRDQAERIAVGEPVDWPGTETVRLESE